MPKISVLMGIYNCADTLPDAIDCILAQTVQDFELILCEDGSKDGTYAVAESYRQKHPDKIVLLRNEKNMGLNYTLNRCLAQAKGEFVARMDGDDRCEAERFQKQLAVLESRPEIALVGSAIRLFDDAGMWGQTRPIPQPQKADFIRGCPFSHGSIMARTAAFRAVGGYSEEEKLWRVEDYHLWMKLYEAGFRGVNLAQPLYDLRDDRDAAVRRSFRARKNESYVMRQAVKRLGLPRWQAVYSLRPLILGVLPVPLYQALHRRKMGK